VVKLRSAAQYPGSVAADKEDLESPGLDADSRLWLACERMPPGYARPCTGGRRNDAVRGMQEYIVLELGYKLEKYTG
jgi:hypothetical protein